MMDDMAKDWVEDESLSRDDILARFTALEPTPTRGPRKNRGVRLTGDVGALSGNRVITRNGVAVNR